MTGSLSQTISTVETEYGIFASPTFSPLNVIQSIFPKEQDLENVDLVVRRMERKLSEVRGDMDVALLEQLEDIVQDGMVADTESLSGKVEELHAELLETEGQLMSLAEGLKEMDAAKKNLVEARKWVRRLKLVENGVRAVKEMQNDQRKVAMVMEGIKPLVEAFKGFEQVPRVKQVLQELAGMEMGMSEDVVALFTREFRATAAMKKTLQDSCVLIDSLPTASSAARARVIQAHIAKALAPYRKLFRGSEELTSLDNLPRRFTWMRRMLKEYAEFWGDGIVPEEWGLKEEIVKAFCRDTREDVGGELRRMVRGVAEGKTKAGFDVKALWKAIRWTVDFEVVLARQCERDPQGEHNAMQGVLSRCFQPFMTYLIQDDESRLTTRFEDWRKPNAPTEDLEDYGTVLRSSIELFQFFKQSLSDYISKSFLSKQNLTDLVAFLRRGLSTYARLATQRVESHPHDRRALVVLLNTCHHAADLVERLQYKIAADAVELGFEPRNGSVEVQRDDVFSLSEQRQQFMSAVMNIIQRLTAQLETHITTLLRTEIPKATNLKPTDAVTDISPWVSKAISQVSTFVGDVNTSIGSPRYRTAFNDRVTNMLGQVLFSVFRQLPPPVTEAISEQLQADLDDFRTRLGHVLGPKETSKRLGTLYSKLLSTSLTNASSLLQVLRVRPSPPSEIADAFNKFFDREVHPDLFKAILDLKGVTRYQHEACLKTFEGLSLLEVRRSSQLAGDLIQTQHAGHALFDPDKSGQSHKNVPASGRRRMSSSSSAHSALVASRPAALGEEETTSALVPRVVTKGSKLSRFSFFAPRLGFMNLSPSDSGNPATTSRQEPPESPEKPVTTAATTNTSAAPTPGHAPRSFVPESQGAAIEVSAEGQEKPSIVNEGLKKFWSGIGQLRKETGAGSRKP